MLQKQNPPSDNLNITTALFTLNSFWLNQKKRKDLSKTFKAQKWSAIVFHRKISLLVKELSYYHVYVLCPRDATGVISVLIVPEKNLIGNKQNPSLLQTGYWAFAINIIEIYQKYILPLQNMSSGLQTITD